MSTHKARRTPWFGNILTWQRSPEPDTWQARHGGTLHEIVKLTRSTADALRTGRGWHLVNQPDQPDVDQWVGPSLGPSKPTALLLAEAHILVPYREWFAAPDAPGFIPAISDPGTYWGERFIAWPDHQRGCLTAHDRDGGRVAEVWPQFSIDAEPAVEQVGLSWAPVLQDGRELDVTPSWHDACASILKALRKTA